MGPEIDPAFWDWPAHVGSLVLAPDDAPPILFVVCFKFVFSKLLGPNISAPTFQDEHFSTCLATMWRGRRYCGAFFIGVSGVRAAIS